MMRSVWKSSVGRSLDRPTFFDRLLMKYVCETPPATNLKRFSELTNARNSLERLSSLCFLNADLGDAEYRRGLLSHAQPAVCRRPLRGQ